MNVVSETFDKQIDLTTSYNFYYSSEYSAPSSINESYSNYSLYSVKGALPQARKHASPTKSISTPQRSSPLTLENVSKVQLADPSSMPLARYCNNLDNPEPTYTPSTASTKKTIRKFHQEDYVLESPRLLPFPYHNDSYFLPTAEHDYPGGCSTTDASSSIVTLSICTSGSRQHLPSSSTSPSIHYPSPRGYQRQLLSSPSKPHFYSARRYDDDTMSNSSHKRRAASVTPSSPSTTREEIIVSQKKRRSNNKFALKFKQNLLRFKSNNSTILECNSSFHLQYPPSSTSTSDTSKTLVAKSSKLVESNQRYENIQYNTTSVNKSTWFERLWKFLKPTSPVKNRKSSTSTSTTVWYSQFKCNPPPSTEITLLS